MGNDEDEWGRSAAAWASLIDLHSRYINHKNRPLCDSFFPNARHIELDTGHWVQAEDPQTFIEELTVFVAGASGPQ